MDGTNHSVNSRLPNGFPAPGALEAILLGRVLSIWFRIETPTSLSRLPDDTPMDREEAIVDDARRRGFELYRLHDFRVYMEP